MAGWIKRKLICAGLAATAASWAQTQPDALSRFQQNAERRSAEWTTLATNLEQRVTRLLPCDPRISAAIEGSGRASEARIAALTTYWMGVAGRSRNQMEAIRRLMTQEEARKDEWASERSHAEEERTAVAEQNGFLAVSVNQLPALAEAQKSLTAATQKLLQIETQMQARELVGNQLAGELRDLLAASQARQNDIDAQIKFISAEGVRWNAYYDARLNRAQMECIITNPGAETVAPAPRAPASQKGKKK